MPKSTAATLMYTTHRVTGITAWYFGCDDADGDHHDRILPDDAAAAIPALLTEFGIQPARRVPQAEQLLIVEIGATAPDWDAVLTACGNHAGSLGRHADKKIVATTTGETDATE